MMSGNDPINRFKFFVRFWAKALLIIPIYPLAEANGNEGKITTKYLSIC
jgi:hypothetical protein